MVTWIGTLLILGVAAYLFVPYILGWDRQAGKKSTKESEDPREVLLSNLADLVYDYKSGKISEEDYQRLRAELEAQLYALEHPESEAPKDDRRTTTAGDSEPDQED